ncbi:hypothetical protein EDD18DRAFT_1337363 [Armillaria luteobubalina]|uniref:Uncharacterized protein n=1 Tax=Armillaria luteobubalina TaxID=153913 RepID=A0AA39P934_9AGAR|nr:hypothetical protein EDD18DRAFT_1337363 [Armillaria luteobubalina]
MDIKPGQIPLTRQPGFPKQRARSPSGVKEAVRVRIPPAEIQPETSSLRFAIVDHRSCGFAKRSSLFQVESSPAQASGNSDGNSELCVRMFVAFALFLREKLCVDVHTCACMRNGAYYSRTRVFHEAEASISRCRGRQYKNQIQDLSHSKTNWSRRPVGRSPGQPDPASALHTDSLLGSNLTERRDTYGTGGYGLEHFTQTVEASLRTGRAALSAGENSWAPSDSYVNVTNWTSINGLGVEVLYKGGIGTIT